MFWFLVAIALGYGGYYVFKKEKKKKKKLAKKKKKKDAPRTIFNLRINDIVSHFGSDYIVKGKLVYEEDGDEWFDYHLEGDDGIIWLSVSDDDELEVGLFRTIKDLKFTSAPPEFIEYEGERFQQEEFGRAKVRRKGHTGSKSAGTCKYYEYEAPGGRLMSVEQWGEGSYEVSVGDAIRPHTLEFLPGDEIEKEY